MTTVTVNNTEALMYALLDVKEAGAITLSDITGIDHRVIASLLKHHLDHGRVSARTVNRRYIYAIREAGLAWLNERGLLEDDLELKIESRSPATYRCPSCGHTGKKGTFHQ
ncbi:hypothetical protein KQI63_05895 [bacterium]|nr:hypothetical protein [bacterium]